MGWSCSRAASDTLNRISREMDEVQKAVGVDRPISNYVPDGFWEHSRVEHNDGAITGSVFITNPETQRAHKIGGFRIDGDGQIIRFPRLPRKIRDKVNAMPVDKTPIIQFVSAACKEREELVKLRAFYWKVANLTLNHQVIADSAVITAKDLGDELEKVNEVWYSMASAHVEPPTSEVKP